MNALFRWRLGSVADWVVLDMPELDSEHPALWRFKCRWRFTSEDPCVETYGYIHAKQLYDIEPLNEEASQLLRELRSILRLSGYYATREN